ncbi:MAG TPA: phosphoribosyltransferase family protein [Thermoplasmata archaeon]|nr:phosphoribosyltransferase family protein [Thermoplasmata archaeon]
MAAPPGPPRRLADRATAGRRLADRLTAWRAEDPLVLALPRGGVPVGYEVARALGAPLDVLVVRKIGAPGNPEYGLGAVAEGGFLYLDAERVAEAGLSERALAPEIRAEEREVERRARVYREGRPRTPLAGRTVVLVDDGVATGGTAIAACRAVRAAGARRVVVALGVCPPDTVPALAREADAVVTVLEPAPFFAVGEWYDVFDQTSDAEVLALLAAAVRR